MCLRGRETRTSPSCQNHKQTLNWIGVTWKSGIMLELWSITTIYRLRRFKRTARLNSKRQLSNTSLTLLWCEINSLSLPLKIAVTILPLLSRHRFKEFSPRVLKRVEWSTGSTSCKALNQVHPRMLPTTQSETPRSRWGVALMPEGLRSHQEVENIITCNLHMLHQSVMESNLLVKKSHQKWSRKTWSVHFQKSDLTSTRMF